MTRGILFGLLIAALLGTASLGWATEPPPFRTFTEASQFVIGHRVVACAGSPDQPMDEFVLRFEGRYYVFMSKQARWVLFRVTENGAQQDTTEPDYVWLGALWLAQDSEPDDTLQVAAAMSGSAAQTSFSGPCAWLDGGGTA